ncbi:MAG: ribosomal L7Ae/L30e/S12e/Gadd45 family protein [Oscillospiraceae bacterium]|nr:ribosomal L7Ae/L30e/S12e/Gadd45 family protein [Oscillospiraceae bacterium]
MTDATERLAGILTICRKAGKLLLGFDAVKEAAQQGQVFSILLACDVSPKTEKEIRFFAGEIPVRKLKMDMETLKHWFRKRTAVYGICEEGFSEKVRALLDAEQAQNM